MIRKRLLYAAMLLLWYAPLTAQQSRLGNYFAEAYKQYPVIPQGILEAAAYSASHMVNLSPHEGSDHQSCMGMPERIGLFGLIEDGKGYFTNNLAAVCRAANITADQFKKDVRQQILAVAKFLSMEAASQRTTITGAEGFAPVLEKLSEIPDDGNAINTHARKLYTYDIYDHLQKGFTAPALKTAPVHIQMEKIYPAETLRTLKAPGVKIDYDQKKIIVPGTAAAQPVSNTGSFQTNSIGSGTTTNGVNDGASVLSADYGPALWDQAHTNNFSVGRGGSVPTNVTIHTAQGTYAGTISWFNNGSAIVSAHYVIRSSDGQITQMVREANRAYHVLNHNYYTIGIEHEGYVNNASWYTENMYQSSAALVRDICNSWTISKSACFPGPATSGTNYQPISVRIKGHQHYSGNSHTDPGINWNWSKYAALINPPAFATTITFNTKDQATGLAVASAAVTVTAPGGSTSNLTTNSSGQLVFGANAGLYTFSFSKSGYNSISTFFTGGVSSAITADINMDPVSALRIATDAVEKIPAAGNTMTVAGYVRDEALNSPLEGAAISVDGLTATTDSKGYFSITLAAPAAITQGKTPAAISIRSAKTGYVSKTIQNFYVVPDTYTLQIGLASVNDAGEQQGVIEAWKHGMFDRVTKDQQQYNLENQSPVINSNRETGATALAAVVPASIRIVTNCACSTCGNEQVQVMSLEAYVQTGVDDEWLSSWNAASLQAGAVAYRSRGAWYVANPAGTNYDISSATCHQTWQNDRATSVKNAAITTAGIILTKNGNVYLPAYAAENNNAGCGDGYSGNGTTWACLSDSRCAGRANNGHGQGMCQWGSSFWGTDQTYSWILNHYYGPDGVTIQTTAALTLSEQVITTTEKLVLTPNPVTGNTIKVAYMLEEASQPATIILTDSYGRPLRQQQAMLQTGQNVLTVRTGKLNAGVYNVSIRLQSGKMESKRVVVVE